MKLKFLGAAKTVTGSFFLVSTDKLKFAVDCGLFQGPKELKERNYGDFAIDPQSIDFLIVTHAHIDHTGLIPKLCKKGFAGPIYCSHATRELAGILLPDSGHIQETEVERKNRKLSRAGQKVLEPIYTAQDAINCLAQLRSLSMDEILPLAPGVEIRLRDAGHILGSCIVELWVEEEGKKTKLVFSGDLGNTNQPIIKDPTIIESADYLLIESTYGNRMHEPSLNRSQQLKKIIDEAMARGGNLIIPAFAVERTQDLLYDLISIYAHGGLDPEISIYIDSPLAIAATEIFLRHNELYDDETRTFMESHENPLQLLNLKFSRSTEDSMRLNLLKNKTIIISASGMCDAGRIKHHLKHNLWRPESTVLFVGFQAQGTLGRRIMEGEKMVTIHGEQVAVKAAIRSVDSYSAHADKAGLINWMKGFVNLPRTIFVVHGEEDGQKALADFITGELKVPAIIPDWLDEFDLNHLATLAHHEEARVHIGGALQAEQAYLDLRRQLNEYFEEKSQTGEYENLLQTLRSLSAQIK